MRSTLVLVGAVALALSGCSVRASVPVEVEAGVVAAPAAEPASDRVWVCHRGRWQEVAAPAADGHSRHGDRVSSDPRRDRGSC